MRVVYRKQDSGTEGQIPDFLKSELVHGTWEPTGVCWQQMLGLPTGAPQYASTLVLPALTACLNHTLDKRFQVNGQSILSYSCCSQSIRIIGLLQVLLVIQYVGSTYRLPIDTFSGLPAGPAVRIERCLPAVSHLSFSNFELKNCL